MPLTKAQRARRAAKSRAEKKRNGVDTDAGAGGGEHTPAGTDASDEDEAAIQALMKDPEFNARFQTFVQEDIGAPTKQQISSLRRSVERWYKETPASETLVKYFTFMHWAFRPKNATMYNDITSKDLSPTVREEIDLFADCARKMSAVTVDGGKGMKMADKNRPKTKAESDRLQARFTKLLEKERKKRHRSRPE
jgi:hypothetical protein